MFIKYQNQEINSIHHRKKIPFDHIIAGLETGILHLNDIQKSEIRNRFINILTNKKHSNTTFSTEDKVCRHLKETREFLKNNTDILVNNTDKGNVTILISKTEYIQKMNILLNDTNPYKRINKDHTLTLEKKANEFFDLWVNENRICESNEKKLKIHNANIARMYGLIKIHKYNSIRPILSCIGAPLYHLSKFLSAVFSSNVGRKQVT